MTGDTVDADRTERLAALFNSSPDAILSVDCDGEIRLANDRVEALFGYEPAELEGEPVETLVPDAAGLGGHADHREAYLADPESRAMGPGLDLRGERKDGTTFPVDVSLSPVEIDGEREIIAAVRDRSECERLERKYRTVMETAPDATFVIDAYSGEILEVNRAATELLGVPESDLVGRNQTDLHPGDETDRYRELFEDHVDRERVTASRFGDGDDIVVETADGDRVPVEVSAQCIQLQGRETVVAMFRDVSERRRYERDRRRQIERLERLAELLSHDLRNPLNVAAGNLELARETEDFERLSDVECAHDRMADILEDALTMVRGGTDVGHVEPLPLADLAEACWEHVATGDASLRVAADGLVYADESRVSHLFENLFRNAVEHAGDGVTVTVGVDEDGFYVTDDGPGIPEGDREAVFESGWTTASEGTGLGLAIVADVAAAHGWDVDVSEGEAGGARFEFAGVRTSREATARGAE